MPTHTLPAAPPLDDADLVHRVSGHDEAAFEQLMRRNNAALFRVARAILKNDADAEDALQEAYLSAFRHIGEFRADAKLSTWLTRIVINQALARLRARHRSRIVVPFGELGAQEQARSLHDRPEEPESGPEPLATRAEIRRLLEHKIDALPVAFRTVFVLREVEEWSVEETAASLAIPEATVRSRLFRARSLLRESLARELDLATGDVFRFDGERCDRIVAGTLARWRRLGTPAADLPLSRQNVGRDK